MSRCEKGPSGTCTVHCVRQKDRAPAPTRDEGQRRTPITQTLERPVTSYHSGRHAKHSCRCLVKRFAEPPSFTKTQKHKKLTQVSVVLHRNQTYIYIYTSYQYLNLKYAVQEIDFIGNNFNDNTSVFAGKNKQNKLQHKQHKIK